MLRLESGDEGGRMPLPEDKRRKNSVDRFRTILSADKDAGGGP